LLVVIAIIGTLVALLLPAVQAAREAARRSQCSSNLKQIALAFHNYESAHHQFPFGYGIMKGPCCVGSALGEEWPWPPRLFPQLEEQALYDMTDFSAPCGYPWSYLPPAIQTVVSAQLSVFHCPSDPGTEKPFNSLQCASVGIASGTQFGPYGRISYAGNTGIGLMEAPSRIKGVMGYNWGAKFSQIHDGTAHTALLSELVIGSECTLRGIHSYDEGPVYMHDFTPNDRTADEMRWCTTDLEPPEALCIKITMPNMVRHTARSHHPGGVHTAFCDGSVRLTSELIDRDTWHALGSSQGHETIVSDEF